MITAGSYSRLAVFETCAFRAKLAYVDKIPEPERPALPNGKEYPNDRGTRVHDTAENFVRGKESMIAELVAFKSELEKLRALYAANPKDVLMEDLWCYDDAWGCLPADIKPWDERIWMRIKLDVCVFLDPQTVVVIDYKTGKRFGNEVKHAEQTQLYQLAVFLRFPQVQKVITELWYTDQDELATMTYQRKQGLRFIKNWNNRMDRMTSEVVFDPKPSTWNCRWCPYKEGLLGKLGPAGTGHCSRNPE